MHHQIASHLAELRVLCRRFGVARMEVFGSAARGDFDPSTSDVDFLVEFQVVERLAPLQQYFGLNEGLERLLNRHVDLIESDAVRNPYVLAEINRARELVYAA
jgi:predicted nucleotidyltransferase